MTQPEMDRYFAKMLRDDGTFRDAVFSLLAVYEEDAVNGFRAAKTTDDLLHAQGMINTIDVLRRYFESRIETEQLIQTLKDEV